MNKELPPKIISITIMEGQLPEDSILWADFPGEEPWIAPHETYYHESVVKELEEKIKNRDEALMYYAKVSL